MDFAVELERDDNGTILVSFPDFPEAHTFGETEEEALARGVDALAMVVEAYIKDRRDVPAPSGRVGRRRVRLPVLVEAKLALYRSMRKAGVNKAELARRLSVHPPQVDRLLAVHHSSRLDQMEAAFAALGQRLAITVEDVPPVRARPAPAAISRQRGARVASSSIGKRR